ncbi:MAG: hypothetical protein U0936_17490 [Planctomycetaceae bacterium]
MIDSFHSPCSHRLIGAALLTLSLLLLAEFRPANAASPGGFSGATMLTADRADMALDTGLWRGEFLKVQEEEESTAPGTSDDENHQGLQSLRANDVVKNSEIVDLDEAAEEYLEAGETSLVESTTDEVLVSVEVPEHLSDWEQAICNVSDGKALAAGQKGPSMITAIVAVVGVIVVIGAYMKK